MSKVEADKRWESLEKKKKEFSKKNHEKRQAQLQNEQQLKAKWLKEIKEKYPKKSDDPDDPNNIDYYEIEA